MICRESVHTLENEAFFARCCLEHQYPVHFLTIQINAYLKAKLQSHWCEAVHETKLNRLALKETGLYRKAEKSTVHNLSSHAPNKVELSVLNLGLNLNLRPAANAKKLVCALEAAVSHVEAAKQDEARTHSIKHPFKAKALVFHLTTFSC